MLTRLVALPVLPALVVSLSLAAAAQEPTWPPKLRGAVEGVVTVEGPELLAVPEKVTEAQKTGKSVAFTVAQTPPKLELTYHGQLGSDAVNRRLWSSWGDIGLADDGKVYCAIGDHGNDQGGDARCFLYVWEPDKKQLRQIVDMNQVVSAKPGQPAWSKVHAKIDPASDGKVYFSCTLNDGNRAREARYGFNRDLPGGQLYCYDPVTGKTEVFADLPPRRCTATSLLDRERNIWWCNLEAGNGDALFGLNLTSRKVVYQGQDGQVAFNRAFALTRNGHLIFNGKQGLSRLDTRGRYVVTGKSALPDSPGMRCASRESKEGLIYGVSHQTNQLYQYAAATDELKLLGHNWLSGEYTTVCELSPDERFLYYLPGSHGKAWEYGTPVIQYEIATSQRKVLAFLAPAVDQVSDYVPAGTYGMKLSTDGSTIYVNFNGHAADKIRPKTMKPIGFGLTAFAVIHIPETER